MTGSREQGNPASWIISIADNKFCLAGFRLIGKQQLGNYSKVTPHVVLGSLGLTEQAEMTLSSDREKTQSGTYGRVIQIVSIYLKVWLIY